LVRHHERVSRLIAVAILCFALPTSACRGNTREVDLPAVEATPIGAYNSMAASNATIAIIEPADGSAIHSDHVTIAVRVKGFSLVDPSATVRRGQGHIVYYMGGSYTVPTSADTSAISGGTGAFVAHGSVENRYRWVNVPSGAQTFAAQLVGNDGAPLENPRVARVTVTVD
jgi:hypothetical protein